jgi:DNA-binding CsgD family transcriptional regulator
MSAAIRETLGKPPANMPNESDRLDALGIMERLARSGSEPDLEAISQELHHVLGHEFFAYAAVRAYDERILRVVNLDFPKDFLQAVGFRPGSDAFVPLKTCFATRAPVLVHDVSELLSVQSLAALKCVPRGALAVHAQMDSTGMRGLVFCFGNLPLDLVTRSEATLALITPYLFSAFARTFWARTKKIEVRPLSAREIEVIEWMYYGKTNEEIADLLEISVHTVKNHVQKILLKLSASNRIQAVLRAADAGIVRGHDTGSTQPRTY